MASQSFVSLLLCITAALAEPIITKRSDPLGVDVSSYQGTVDWSSWKSKGVTFAYIKATEGTTLNTLVRPMLVLFRGGYHFARPDSSTGAAQASYFLKHGGGWSADGITLPGALDIEYNPSGSECYGLSASSMVSWIKSFSDAYHSSTTRNVIYTTTDWWKSCTGNSASFGSMNPLWIAHPGSSIGTLPAGWSYTTFWQYGTSDNTDVDKFNGDSSGLER
ncbi:glycoside hydrolase family 25 protein [Suillus paluster]|uniref:glycoside hydrolase family 25 protein n=1 Tax=Suillus paluster TaxID=48578 RepID=UPI001B88438F|nr:glycoside hydrolase family 25 protein [Suillus paluster]KAG1753794.1 glycoside hydrolase family 25 protein [Suillus paluster]